MAPAPNEVPSGSPEAAAGTASPGAAPPAPPAQPPAQPADAAEVAASGAGTVFANGAFRCLFGGSLCSTLGDRLFNMAVIGAVMIAFGQAAREVALITIAGVLPQVLIYPFVGSMVDAVDRRRLLWGICLVKLALVLPVIYLLSNAGDPSFHESWGVLLPAVFVLSLISVPFSPARAAAVPDVVPAARLGMAASLLAATGLISILLGTFVGGKLAVVLGPAWVVPIAAALFGLGVVALRALPKSVAVPGMRRPGGELEHAAGAASAAARVKAYLRETWTGLRYCTQRRGVTALILFETTFWATAVTYYTLHVWHAVTKLHLAEKDSVTYFAAAMGVAGLGLIAGVALIGKLCRIVTPLYTYPLSYLAMGAAMAVILGREGIAGPQALSEAYAQLPWLFAFGVAGGTLIGRVDADMLAVVEAPLRGRVFSVKGFVFSAAMLGTLFGLSLIDPKDDAAFETVAYVAPRMLMWLVPAVLVLAWLLDCGIYANRAKVVVGSVETLSYWVARAFTQLAARTYFRQTLVGGEKLPRTGPVILAANHGSFGDPFWLGCMMPRRVQYLMHASYYNGIGHPFYRLMATVPVDTTSQTRALKQLAAALEEGICVGMFPEGHVSDDQKLQKPENGVAFLAKRTGAPVYPVAIKGNTKAYWRQARIPRPYKITVIVGDPVVIPPETPRQEIPRYSDLIMERIAEMLGEPPPPKAYQPKEGKGETPEQPAAE